MNMTRCIVIACAFIAAIGLTLFTTATAQESVPPYVYILEGNGLEIPQYSVRNIHVRAANLKSTLNRDPSNPTAEPDYQVVVGLSSGLTFGGDCAAPSRDVTLDVPGLRDEHTFILQVQGCSQGSATISTWMYVDMGGGNLRSHVLPDPRQPSLTPTPWPRRTGTTADSVTSVTVSPTAAPDIEQYAQFHSGVAGRHVYLRAVTLYREPFPQIIIPGVNSAQQGNADVTLHIIGSSLSDFSPSAEFVRVDDGIRHDVFTLGVPQVTGYKEALTLPTGGVQISSSPSFNALVFDLNQIDELRSEAGSTAFMDPHQEAGMTWSFESLQWHWIYNHPWTGSTHWPLNGLTVFDRELFIEEWPEFEVEDIRVTSRGASLSGLSLSATDNICAEEPETRLEKITIGNESVDGTVVWECLLRAERPRVRAEAAVDDYLLIDRSAQGSSDLYASIHVDSELDLSQLKGKMGAKARSWKPGTSPVSWGTINLSVNMRRDSTVPTTAEPILRFTGTFTNVPLSAETWIGYETDLYRHDLRVEVEMEYTMAVYFGDRDSGSGRALDGSSLQVDMRGLPDFRTVDHADYTLNYIASYSCPCASPVISYGSVSWSGSITCYRGDGTSYQEGYSGSRRVISGCGVNDPPPSHVTASHMDERIRIQENLGTGSYHTYVVRRKHTMETPLATDYKMPSPSVVTGLYPASAATPTTLPGQIPARWWWSDDG